MTLEIKHKDGNKDKVKLNHTYNAQQIEWFKYGSALNMNANERKISFLNRYFIFKKVRNVDAQKVSTALIHNKIGEIKDDIMLSSTKEEVEEEEEEEGEKEVIKEKQEEEVSKTKITSKKTKRSNT